VRPGPAQGVTGRQVSTRPKGQNYDAAWKDTRSKKRRHLDFGGETLGACPYSIIKERVKGGEKRSVWNILLPSKSSCGGEGGDRYCFALMF